MDKEQVDKIVEMLDSRDAAEIKLARDMLGQVLPDLPKFHKGMLSDDRSYIVMTLFQRNGEWCVEENHLWIAVSDTIENQPLLYMGMKDMGYKSRCSADSADPIYGKDGPLSHAGLSIVSIHPKPESDGGTWVKDPTRTSNITMRSTHPAPPLESYRFTILDLSEDNITK